MLQGLDVFLSKHDIESGARWALELATQLQDTDFGVICLTTENLTSPWLLFEAGALTKQLDGRACCLLIGTLEPTDVTGPLAQFQNRKLTKEGFSSLFADLNRSHGRALVDSDQVRILAKFWPDIELVVKEAEARKEPAARPEPRSDRALLEEILLGIRRLEQISGPQPQASEFNDRLARDLFESCRLANPRLGSWLHRSFKVLSLGGGVLELGFFNQMHLGKVNRDVLPLIEEAASLLLNRPITVVTSLVTKDEPLDGHPRPRSHLADVALDLGATPVKT